jgi:hypothetical protein
VRSPDPAMDALAARTRVSRAALSAMLGIRDGLLLGPGCPRPSLYGTDSSGPHLGSGPFGHFLSRKGEPPELWDRSGTSR